MDGLGKFIVFCTRVGYCSGLLLKRLAVSIYISTDGCKTLQFNRYYHVLMTL